MGIKKAREYDVIMTRFSGGDMWAASRAMWSVYGWVMRVS